MTNREIAQEISNRIGTAPVPFDSVYSIALEIYHQLGGEESQFDSVYSILLEILPLVEGGGSGKAIEIVDALPEASENKEKFYRLSSDDNVYVSELKSRTTITTNRLPDAQQIDKAYLYDYGGAVAYYNGFLKLICDDGEISGYIWFYNGNEEALFTLDNAENVLTNSEYVYLDMSEWQISGDTAIGEGYSVEDIRFNPLSDNDIIPIPATYNAPEANQIGNATFYAANIIDDLCTYTGIQETVTLENQESFTGYKWEVVSDYYVLTDKPASEIYAFVDTEYDKVYSDLKVVAVSEGVVNSQDEILTELYIPQLNAPDSEQVDNAYLEMETHYKGNGKFYYKGEIQIREYDYETVSSDYVIGHLWETEDKYNHYITLTNAQNIYGGNIGGHFADEDLQNYGDEIGWASTTYTLAEIPSLFSYYDTDYIISQVPSTVKYQRTETTEEWGWEKVAVKEDIKPAIIDVESLPDEVTDANKGNIYRMEGDANYAATYTYGILPDDEQINEAYFEYYTDCQGLTYYKGTFKVICTDGEINGYGWYSEGEFNNLFITQYNAVNISDTDDYLEFSSEVMTLTIDWDTNTATVNVSTEYDEIYSGVINELQDYVGITKAEGNVLQWSAIATEGYVDDAIENIPEYSAGSNISISDDREISCTYQYTLPTASNSTKGGIKVGSGLSINNDVLSTNVSEEEVDAISNSVIGINKEVRYLTPLNEQYLTFEAVTECTIKFICNTSNSTYFRTIEVSKDKLTWTSVTSSYYDGYSAPSGGTVIANLLPTEKIYLRGNNGSYADLSSGYEIINQFTFINGKINVYGNIMSLVNAANYKNLTTLTNERTFQGLFDGCTQLLDVSDLLLPATTLTDSCYRRMFRNCVLITTTPILPATTLADRCYDSMFKGCFKLNHIKCLATDISASKCTYEWVKNVAPNGVFEKNSSMSSWPTSVNGIPSGWTSQDYIEPNYPATEEYVDEEVSSKANKVDYVVQLNPMTQQYDWTSLNSVTETGVYRISIEVDMMGTVMKMGAGDLFVQNTGTALVQTILLPSDDSIASHVRTSSNGGTSWTDSDVIVPSINDSATTSLTETYSIDKINSLISALDSRLTAIGG